MQLFSLDLIEAIKAEDVDSVMHLIQSARENIDVDSEEFVNSRDSEGLTPLLWASAIGNADIIQLLVGARADIHYICKKKESIQALHVASERGHVEAVGLLISYGANMEAADKAGRTPLQIAVEHKRGPVVNLLLTRGVKRDPVMVSGETPLFWAVREGRSGPALILIRAGADKAATGPGLESLVHCAIRNQDCAMLALLLQHSCPLSTKNKDGQTPLHLAVLTDFVEGIESLLQGGANVKALNEDGETALVSAVLRSASYLPVERVVETMEILLQHSADVNARDFRYNRSLVHWAARHPTSSAAMLAVLLQAKPNLTLTDDEGQTALHWACVAGAEEAAGLLVQHRSNCNALDRRGRTPLHLAALNGHEGIAQLLVNKGGCVLPACEGGSGTIQMVKNKGDGQERMLSILAKAQILNEHTFPKYY